jgi:rhodanese-related sulfurtransferase
MKKIVILFLLSILGAGIIVAAAPKIEVDNATLDFGEVKEGDLVTHIYVLTNAGDEPLVIEKITPWCGCTTIPSLSKTELAPGETAELEAVLDTAGLGVATINKSITVYSNDPETPELVLRMKGSMKQIEMQPYQIASADLHWLFYLLVDLREAEEYATGHLMGAINIPYAELDEWIDRLPRILIILYDKDGSLSDQAAQTLEEAGFYEAKSLFGGFDEWTRRYRDKYIFPLSESEEPK